MRQNTLDRDRIRLTVFSDYSFADGGHLSTQNGYRIILTDHTHRVNVMHFRSYKPKRIVRYILGGEMYPLAEEFNAAYISRHDMERAV